MATFSEPPRTNQPLPTDLNAVENSFDQARPCPCCGATMLATPIIVCSHCGKELEIKCYIYRRKGNFYGECLTLNLISRGATQEEAIVRLQRAMFSYVEAVLVPGKSTKGLIPRRAPLASWIKYYLHTSQRRFVRIFGITDSLAMKTIRPPNAIEYKVVEC
jgi:hypothetical protein